MSYAHNESDLTALMTTNNDPSPNITAASSEYNTNFAAHYAFDHNGSTQWASNYLVGGPWWIYYNFGSALYVVNSYTITASAATDEAPKTWKFQGGNNGADDWTDLDTQTNASAWTAAETRTFSFANATAYQYYRLYITAVQTGGYASLYEIEMFGEAGRSPACYLHARRDRLNMRPISTQNCLE